MQSYNETFAARQNQLNLIKINNDPAEKREQLENFICAEKALIDAIPSASGPLLDQARAQIRTMDARPTEMTPFALCR